MELGWIDALYNENKEHATIIVAGCISTIASERITSIANDIIQINNNNMDMFDEYFYSKVKIKNVDFNIEPKRHHSSGDPFIVIDNEEKQDKKFVERIDELTGLKNGIIEIVVLILILYFSIVMLFDYKESKDPNFKSPFNISMTKE